MRPVALLVVSALVLTQGYARLEQSLCGTHRDRRQEEIYLHRHVTAKRKGAALAVAAPAAQDIGQIAILEDSDGVVARRNEFNLNGRTVQFSPIGADAARYRFQTGESSYDAAAASAGSPLSQIGDDDSVRVALPFTFPFFGAAYREIFVNSDGNLTFVAGDAAITDRSLGRLVAGAPRIAGLFMDLDPTRSPGALRVLSEPGRFVVSWAGVPQYQDFGTGAGETFQIRLYPDGRIEIAYGGVVTDGAVVGISPGGLQGPTSIVSFAGDASGEYSSTVAERFGGTEEIDIVTAAQKFYQTHDDAYDYLVFYNNLGINACAGSVACETTVRNNRSGYGDTLVEIGGEFGSPSRLQAVLNLGPLGQYPKDPAGIVPARATIRDTPVTVIAHESGHLFLAYASVRDPNDSSARPMLGFQNAHWAFTFNSEASLLEGNRIRDDGPAVSPRFTITGTVEGYSPLDQYLMGFRAPEEVAATFLVTGASRSFTFNPGQTGVSFDGQRRDVTTAEIIAAEGRRTPDSTVSQRRFRFAFVLIVRQGSTPPQADLDQIESYRRQFEAYYGQAASNRASADASLRMSLRLSMFPAAGVLAGQSVAGSISIQKPAAAPLSIVLKTQTGAAGVDTAVTIPAGGASVSFKLTGIHAGVDELSAQPADSRYDSAVSRIQVLAGPDAAQLTLESGDSQPVAMRVSDGNNLPYPGVRVQASAAGSGSVTPAVAVSDAAGRVNFNWTPGAGSGQVLTARLEGSTGAPLLVSAPAAGGRFSFSAPVNAASGAPGLSPGGMASIYGSGLSGAQVLLDGRSAPVLFTNETQVNFVVPLEQSVGMAQVTVVNGGISSDLPALTPVTLVSPGIFFDAATGYGAIAARGESADIYATGLGPAGDAALVPQVTIGGGDATVVSSGLAAGVAGVYVVKVEIPADLPPGDLPLKLTVNGVESNTVKIGVR
jgi:uncharacterized protein (TIGR03437 family)